MQAQLNVQRKTDLLARTRKITKTEKASLMRRPRIVGTLKPALLAFRESEFVLIDQITKTWGSAANGNLFSVVSELDLPAVWADLAEFGFVRDAKAMPVPNSLQLKAERLARAPERRVRLATSKRDTP